MRFRPGAAIAVGVIIAVVVWLLLRGGGGHATNHPTAARTHVGPMSVAQLGALPGQVGHPVYWAGPRSGHTYEVTWAPKGNVFVRYLTAGAPIGTRSQQYLVVATYPESNAYAQAQQGSRLKGALVLHLGNGGLGVLQPAIPHSVYVAYPGVPVLIEVYAPSPAFARRLVTSGQITPVG
jgi:hypothetical protein